MNLSLVVAISTLILGAMSVNAFFFWWAFFEEETDGFHLETDRCCMDILHAAPIFIEMNLQKVNVLYLRCQFFVQEFSLLTRAIRARHLRYLLGGKDF